MHEPTPKRMGYFFGGLVHCVFSNAFRDAYSVPKITSIHTSVRCSILVCFTSILPLSPWLLPAATPSESHNCTHHSYSHLFLHRSSRYLLFLWLPAHLLQKLPELYATISLFPLSYKSSSSALWASEINNNYNNSYNSKKNSNNNNTAQIEKSTSTSEGTVGKTLRKLWPCQPFTEAFVNAATCTGKFSALCSFGMYDLEKNTLTKRNTVILEMLVI